MLIRVLLGEVKRVFGRDGVNSVQSHNRFRLRISCQITLFTYAMEMSVVIIMVIMDCSFTHEDTGLLHVHVTL